MIFSLNCSLYKICSGIKLFNFVLSRPGRVIRIVPEGEGRGEMEVAARASTSSSSSSSSSSEDEDESGGQAEVSSSNVRAPTPYPVQMVPAGAESDEESDMDVFVPPEQCTMDCIRATADSRTRRCRHGCRYCRLCKEMTERDIFCECENS